MKPGKNRYYYKNSRICECPIAQREKAPNKTGAKITFGLSKSGALVDSTAPPMLYVEGFSADGEEQITLNFLSSLGDTANNLDKVKVGSERVKVQLSKIQDDATSDAFNEEKELLGGAVDHLEHSKAIDKDQGAYIPLNNDDDDYNGKLDLVAAQTLSNQENDLIPVYVYKGNNDTGNGEYTYSLTVGQNLRLWTDTGTEKRDFDGSYLSFGGSEVLKFYVDAKESTLASQKIELKVIHVPSNKIFKQVLYASTFEISGPLNVPDYSVYEYSVESSRVAGQNDTMW